MNEYVTLYQSIGGLLGIVLGCFFYSLGGRSSKWRRRFIASFIIALTVNILLILRGLWSPYALVIWPLLSIGFHLGYGSEIFIEKVIKRTIYALAIILSGFLLAFMLGGNAWGVLILHIGVGLWSVYLGVKNPVEAAAEEFFVCLFLTSPLIMYPFT